MNAALPNISFPSDKHAIKSMGFTIGFTDGLEPPSLLAVLEGTEMFAGELPKLTQKQAITIQFDSKVASQSKEMSGFARTRIRPNGLMEKELQVGPDRAAFLFGNYESFSSALPESERYLSRVTETLAAFARASFIALQYHDEIYWHGPPSTVDYSRIFSNTSENIAHRAYASKAHWHSHMGFMEGAYLTNVNCEVGRQNSADRTVIAIRTVHRMDVPADMKLNELIGSGLFGNEMKKMHQMNKRALSGLLSEEIRSSIGLQ